MWGKRIERVAFSLSLVFFAMLYGWAAAVLGWFPDSLITSGVRQADALFGRSYLVSRVYDREGVASPDPSRAQPGLTLIATMWRSPEGWGPGLRLIDDAGEILHHWRVDPREIFPNSEPRELTLEDAYIHGSHLFENGDVLVNLETVGTSRLDACGGVVWALPDGSHHSVATDDNGGFWIPSLEYWDDPTDIEGVGKASGLEAPLINNRILHVSAGGKVLDDISLLDVLYRNGLQRYLVKTGQWTWDVLHTNDVEPLSEGMAKEYPLFAAGDLLVSLRNPSLVLVFDPVAGIVKWHASDPFIQQHDPDFIGDGWIGVFDNNQDGTERGTRLGGSRIIAVQPHTGSTRVLFPTPHAEPFYTDTMGKWQLLENGNLLLTESKAGRVVEVDPSGRTVWEWVHEPFDETQIAEVSEGTRYPLTLEQVAGWPCAPEEGIGKTPLGS